ncbi:MAG: hypothetical protein Q9221_005629 [Calogaya cf. arnoldii]
MADPKAPNAYFLDHGIISSTRENTQHYLWQRELQYTLHPSIPTPLPGTAVADIGSRTGVWLLEVAQQYPNVQCQGLDISIAQAPPAKWLPSNVSFTIWDVLQAPPSHLHAKFDIIHIRLLRLVLGDESSLSIIKHIAMLLKPNGYLQWEELDMPRSIIATAVDSIKPVAISCMDAMMKSAWSSASVPKIADFLRENGFRDVKCHYIEARMGLLNIHTDMHILAWMEAVSWLPAGSERRQELEEFVNTLQAEAAQGARHGAAKIVFVAQRD